MLRRSWLIAIPVLAFLAAPALGQAPVDLKWKFEKGKIFYQEMTTEVVQHIKVQGQDLQQRQKSTFWYQWTPLKEEKVKEGTEEVTKKKIHVPASIGVEEGLIGS